MFLIIPIICLLPSSSGHLRISDDDYKLLPPIYGMEDFKQCARGKNIYCTADIKLDSFYKNSSTWKLIEETRREQLLYNHDTIHRGICVPKMYENRPEEIEYFGRNVVSREIEKLNLTLATVNITCNQKFSVGTTGIILLCLVGSYLILIFGATLYDLIIRRSGSMKGNHILVAFSLGNNYKKIFDQSGSKDYQKLKCIQGLRTVTSILIVWLHTRLSYVLYFVEDTIYLEDKYQSGYIITELDMLLMQVFLLISAWLLTIQVLDIFEANKEFTLKDAILLFINRCFRFWPALLFAMSFQMKVFAYLLADIPLSNPLDLCDSACRNNWWATLLFIQNFMNLKDMCYGFAWYLSADIQLYIISLAILYTMLKFKSSKILLGICMFISYALFGFIIYLYDLDVVFRFSPEASKWSNFFSSSNLGYLYTMPHVNSIAYILGICFGTFYYRLQDNHIPIKKIFLRTWSILFFSLPALAVAIATVEFKGLAAALVGPMLRLMFSLGIGTGILGMSQSTGGIVKRVFEWRPLEFLGQFTFCSYMFHYFVVFIRVIYMQQPLSFSTGILITSAIQDVICSFVFAFFMYLSVELPWRNIQKIYLPQVKKRTMKSE